VKVQIQKFIYSSITKCITEEQSSNLVQLLTGNMLPWCKRGFSTSLIRARYRIYENFASYFIIILFQLNPNILILGTYLIIEISENVKLQY